MSETTEALLTIFFAVAIGCPIGVWIAYNEPASTAWAWTRKKIQKWERK